MKTGLKRFLSTLLAVAIAIGIFPAGLVRPVSARGARSYNWTGVTDRSSSHVRFDPAKNGIPQDDVNKIIDIFMNKSASDFGVRVEIDQDKNNYVEEVRMYVSSAKELAFAMFWGQFATDYTQYYIQQPNIGKEYKIIPAWRFRNLLIQEGYTIPDEARYFTGMNANKYRIIPEKDFEGSIYASDWPTFLIEAREYVMEINHQDMVAIRPWFFTYYTSGITIEMAHDMNIIMEKGNGEPAVTWEGKRGPSLMAVGAYAAVNMKGPGTFTLRSEVKFHGGSFNNSDNWVYYGPVLCLLNKYGKFNVRDCTLNISSRGVDRYLNSELTYRMEGRDGTVVVWGKGGETSFRNAQVKYHTHSMVELYRFHTYWGWGHRIEKGWLTGDDAGFLVGNFDNANVSNCTIDCKNGDQGHHSVDDRHSSTIFASQLFYVNAITAEKSDISIDDTSFKNCAVEVENSRLLLKDSSICSRNDEDGIFTALRVAGKSSASLQHSRIYGSGRDNYGLTVSGEGNVLSITGCEIVSKGENAVSVDDKKLQSNVTDTNLMIGSTTDNYVSKGWSKMFLSGTRQQDNVKIYTLSEDGTQVLARNAYDIKVAGENGTLVDDPFSTQKVKNSKTSDSLRKIWGGKTFGESLGKYPEEAEYNYNDYCTLNIDAGNTEGGATEPSKLPAGEEWSIVYDKDYSASTAWTTNLEDEKTVRLWVLAPNPATAYSKITAEQQVHYYNDQKDPNAFENIWIPLQKNAFFGPKSEGNIETSVQYNPREMGELACVDVPVSAPGRYKIRFNMIHRVSGQEYSKVFTLTVKPWNNRDPVAYLEENKPLDYYIEESNEFRVGSSPASACVVFDDPSSNALKRFNTNYDTGSKNPAQNYTNQNLDTSMIRYNALQLYANQKGHVAREESRTLRLQMFTNIRATSLEPSFDRNSRISRCWGMEYKGYDGKYYYRDYINYENDSCIPVRVGYKSEDSTIGCKEVGPAMELVFVPEVPTRPTVEALEATDAQDAGITFEPKNTYNVYSPDMKTFKLENSHAVRVSADKIYMRNTLEEGISEVNVQAFAPEDDPNDPNRSPVCNENLLSYANGTNSLYGTSIHSSSQHNDIGYTAINNLTCRIPANIFKQQEPLRWYLAVTMRTIAGYDYTHYYELFDVSKFGSFSTPQINTGGNQEGSYPLNWNGKAAAVLEGPAVLPLTMTFRGVPVPEDQVKLVWYRRQAGSAETGTKVLEEVLTINDKYHTRFEEDRVYLDFPVKELVTSELSARIGDYEFYPAMAYIRRGTQQSELVSALDCPDGGLFTAHIKEVQAADIAFIKTTEGYYYPKDSEVLALPDIPVTDLTGNETGSFNAPAVAAQRWAIVGIRPEAGATYDCEWVLNDVCKYTGKGIKYESPTVIKKQVSTETVSDRYGDEMCYRTTLSDGNEYLIFAFELNTDSVRLRPGTEVETYEEFGDQYVRGKMAVHARVTRRYTNESGYRKQITTGTEANRLFVYQSAIKSLYDESVSTPAVDPRSPVILLGDKKGNYTALHSSGDKWVTEGKPFDPGISLSLTKDADMLKPSVQKITVDWYGKEEKNSGESRFLGSADFTGETIRRLYQNSSSTMEAKPIFLGYGNGVEPYIFPVADGQYIYAVIHTYDDDAPWLLGTYTTAVEKIPSYSRKAQEPIISSVMIDDKTITPADMLTGKPAAGELRREDVKYSFNTDEQHSWLFNVVRENPEDKLHTTLRLYRYEDNSGHHSGVQVLTDLGEIGSTDTGSLTKRIEVSSRGELYLLEVETIAHIRDGGYTEGYSDRADPVYRYIPVLLTSSNAMPAMMDRSSESGEKYFYYRSEKSRSETEPSFCVTDWISPGKVEFVKDPGTEWAEGGRRLVLCRASRGSENTFFEPLVEMEYTSAGYQKLPFDQWYSTSSEGAYNDTLFTNPQYVFQTTSGAQYGKYSGDTQVRADGSVLLGPGVLDSMLNEYNAGPDYNRTQNLVFVAISRVKPLNAQTKTTACAVNKASERAVLRPMMGLASRVKVDQSQLTDDMIGISAETGKNAPGKPSVRLQLMTRKPILNQRVRYTWYAYDMTRDTLIVLGNDGIRNNTCVYPKAIVENETVRYVVDLPMVGALSQNIDGQYEVFCAYESIVDENYDGSPKVSRGMVGVLTKDGKAPVFGDTENQTIWASYENSPIPNTDPVRRANPPAEWNAETYKTYRQQTGHYGTAVKLKGPATAVKPNYIAESATPTLPRYSAEGVSFRWDWGSSEKGIGEIVIVYSVLDSQGTVVARKTINDCGKNVTLPVYTGAEGDYTIDAFAFNYYTLNNTQAEQTFTANYHVGAAKSAWKPVITEIGDVDTTLAGVEKLSFQCELDTTNYDGGILSMDWQMKNGSEYVTIASGIETLYGSTLLSSGINSVGEYELRLVVTNNSGPYTEQAMESFRISVRENISYAVVGTIKDELFASKAKVALYPGDTPDGRILDGTASALPILSNLDKDPPVDNKDGTFTHSYQFMPVPDGDYKVAVTRDGKYPVIMHFMVIGEVKILSEVDMVLYGVSVTGTVTSYLDASEPVTLQLIGEGHTAPDYETTVTGNSAAFTFDSVPAGKYTLRVMKKNHVTRDYAITVTSTGAAQDVKICPLGDVTGDGRLNNIDVLMLRKHIAGIQLLTDSYKAKCADVKTDGKLNNIDALLMRKHISGMTPLW